MSAYTFPVVGGRITSEFGKREAPTAGASVNHAGIDVSVPTGTSVMAALPGVIKSAGYNPTYGYNVVLSHGDGLETVYKHLSRILTPKAGTAVSQGQIFALSGNTGSATTGAHLHFEMKKDGKAVDPMSFSVVDRISAASGIDFNTDSLIGILKQNWWIIALALIVLTVIRK